MTDDVKQQPDDPDATTADGSGTTTEKTAAEKKREPVHLFYLEMPEPISNVIHSINDFAGKLRRKTIEAAPPFVVNNASNVIATAHLTAEAMMFKANGSMLIEPHRKGNPINYLIDPPRNIFKSVMMDAKSSDFRLRDLVRPSFYPGAARQLTDTAGATAKDLKVQGALINRWQARSTLLGLCTWTLTMLAPDAKEKEEDVAKMTKLSVQNPIGYVAERLRQAVWFPVDTVIKLGEKAMHPREQVDIGQNKRQFTGLGVFVYGICSSLGAWRNVGKPPGGVGPRFYYFNWAYLATGVISMVSSLPLIFETESGKGWSHYGSLFLMRLGFLPPSIAKKYKANDPGKHWYTGAAGIFQSCNAGAALLGGAQKLEDGTIVDHNEEQAAIKHEAIAEKKMKKQTHSEEKNAADEVDVPSTQIMHGKHDSRLAAAPSLTLQDAHG